MQNKILLEAYIPLQISKKHILGTEARQAVSGGALPLVERDHVTWILVSHWSVMLKLIIGFKFNIRIFVIKSVTKFLILAI